MLRMLHIHSQVWIMLIVFPRLQIAKIKILSSHQNKLQHDMCPYEIHWKWNLQIFERIPKSILISNMHSYKIMMSIFSTEKQTIFYQTKSAVSNRTSTALFLLMYVQGAFQLLRRYTQQYSRHLWLQADRMRTPDITAKKTLLGAWPATEYLSHFRLTSEPMTKDCRRFRKRQRRFLAFCRK